MISLVMSGYRFSELDIPAKIKHTDSAKVTGNMKIIEHNSSG